MVVPFLGDVSPYLRFPVFLGGYFLSCPLKSGSPLELLRHESNAMQFAFKVVLILGHTWSSPRRVRWCRKESSIPESPRRNSNLHIPLAPQNHGFSGKLGPQNERKLILERPTFHWTMITGGRVFLFWQWCFHDFWKFGIFLPHAIVFDHSPASSTAQNLQGGPLEACEHQPSADQMRLVWTFPHHF